MNILRLIRYFAVSFWREAYRPALKRWPYVVVPMTLAVAWAMQYPTFWIAFTVSLAVSFAGAMAAR